MTIEKGTQIGRRNGPQVDGVQGYDWFKYCTNELFSIVGVGHHKPTIEQMLDAGCMVVVPTIYDPSTHKLVLDSFSDDGISIWQNTVALTAEEIITATTNLKSSLVAYTKAMANRLIVDIIPEWKQRNASARAIELQEIRHEAGELSYDEAAELLMIREIFTDTVKPLRSASDVIEVEIESGLITTTEQIDNYIAWRS